MQLNQYQFKFYLNASHSIYIDGLLGQEHPHTWEMTILTMKVSDDFVVFNDIEKIVDDYLRPFQNTYLNRLPEFAARNPTVENICRFFKDALQMLLYKNGWVLLRIEVSETPVRSYIIDISDEAVFQDQNSEIKLNNQAIEKAVSARVDQMTKDRSGETASQEKKSEV